MAQTRVFSWKIDDNKYGYLYIDDEKTNANDLICDRITDEGKLTLIADKVSQWTEHEYSQNFSKLNNAILSKYSVSIPGTYKDYFNGETKNYIVLTGKDGSNYSGNKVESVNADVVNKIKTLVSSELSKAKKELSDDVKKLKDSTIGKVEDSVASLKTEVESVKTELIANNNLMANKLEAAEESIKNAAVLYDLNGSSITKESLGNSINNSKEALNRVGSAELAIAEQTQAINNVNSKVTNLTTATETISKNITTLTNNVESRITNIETSITTLNETVESIKTPSQMNESEQEEAHKEDRNLGAKNISPDINSDVYTDITNNEDGSYTITTNVGNESYTFKAYGYGKKIKVREIEDGLVLASNGFRYKDSSGSIISMIGGNILLSNADGSGKLEIKKDGIYINGTKQ